MSDITRNRHQGSETSVLAHRAIKDSLPRKRAAVLALFQSRPFLGFTVHEVAKRLGVPVNSVSGRLTELKKSKHLRPNGKRRGNAAVLVVTERGSA